MEAIKKIVVIGPESTGKSTLCKNLAAHYNSLWVPEYAREYLEKNGTQYNYENLLDIAKGQIALEDRIAGGGYQVSGMGYQRSGISAQRSAISNHVEGGRCQVPGGGDQLADGISEPTSNLKPHPSSLKPLFIDTDMYVMKVWCEFVFNKCHNWILNRIAERPYDLYLLCDIDLPWVEDALREYPDKSTREKLYHYYKDLMVNQSRPWCNISGNYEERFKKAVDFIEKGQFDFLR
ncbi:MAG: ATP-binding protein [Ginsengibacter sp.]